MTQTHTNPPNPMRISVSQHVYINHLLQIQEFGLGILGDLRQPLAAVRNVVGSPLGERFHLPSDADNTSVNFTSLLALAEGMLQVGRGWKRGLAGDYH